MLLHLIPPLELRLKRCRGSPNDHGLRASWLQKQIPLTPEALAASPELSTMAGHITESTLGATASGIPFGLLITQTDTSTEDAPHIVSMPLSTFMLLA